MTSRISYLKLVKEDIKRRGWLAALSCILMLIILPILTLQGLDSQLNRLSVSEGTYTMNEIVKWLVGQLGYQNNSLIILIILGAFLCGITGFSYLHSQEKVDFYHGLPLRRSRLFFISYLSGFLIFIIPYIISYLLCFLIGLIKGIMIPEAFITFLFVSGFHTLFFLLIYSLTILAMMMTGKIIIGILGGIVFLSYGPIVIITIEALCHKFLITYANPMKYSLQMYTSPVTAYFVSAIKLSDSSVSLKATAIALTCVILFTAIAFLLYRIRPSEAAEHAMAFRKTESIIKILIVMPLSIFIGIFTTALTGYPGVAWIVIGAVLSALLLCAVIDFICHMDFSKILKNKISTGVAVAGVLLILGIMNYDILGYDTYIPNKDKLEKMSLHIDQLSANYSYSSRYGSYFPDSDSILEQSMITEFLPIYQLACDGIAQTEITNKETSNSSYDNNNLITVSIKFLLKNGNSVYRNYSVDKSEVENCLNELSEVKSYKEKLFPIFDVKGQNILKMHFLGIAKELIPLDLKQSEQNHLLETYQNDIAKMEFKEMTAENTVGELMFTLTADQGIRELSDLPVYLDNKDTIDLLQKYGYPAITDFKIDDIASIKITDYRSESTEAAKSYQFQETKDLHEILDAISYFPNDLLGSNVADRVETVIYLKDSTKVYCFFKNGEIPSILEQK